MKKVKLKLNRPIYVGFSVLYLAKTLMYEFHYSYILNKYQEKTKLLFTDTESLCYEIKTPDIYKDMTSDSHYFDMSDYHQDHSSYSTINKKGLRSKMYSLLYDGKEKKTAKGISRSVVKKTNLS